MPQQPFFMQWFFGLPPELMTALATVLGFALMGDLNANQQNSLGNCLMLIAQVLETNATQQQLLQGNAQNQQLADMQRSIDELRAELARLRGEIIPPPPQ